MVIKLNWQHGARRRPSNRLLRLNLILSFTERQLLLVLLSQITVQQLVDIPQHSELLQHGVVTCDLGCRCAADAGSAVLEQDICGLKITILRSMRRYHPFGLRRLLLASILNMIKEAVLDAVLR